MHMQLLSLPVFQAVAQPRTHSVRSLWPAVGKHATVKISDFGWMGHQARGSIESLVFFFRPFLLFYYSVACYGVYGFVERLVNVWQVSEQGRAVSKKTSFINRKITRRYVKEGAAQQLVKQEICKGNDLLSCRGVHGCVLRADKKISCVRLVKENLYLKTIF